MNVGKAIQSIMKEKCYTQDYVAKKAGVLQQRISEICNQKHLNTKTLTRISLAIGVKPSDIIVIAQEYKD